MPHGAALRIYNVSLPTVAFRKGASLVRDWSATAANNLYGLIISIAG